MENITEDQFNRYEGVRVSGVTNMFNIKVIIEITDLTKEQILEIMRNYKELSKKFIN